MALITARLVVQTFMGLLFYISVGLDFAWWTLIQRGEVTTETFDYIVVGGGSGGSVVAGRLSENGKYSVLLLEAGPAPSLLHRIPVVGAMSICTAYDWNYLTEPQENACLAMEQRRSFFASGRVLGGSAVLNLMLYVRGQRHDYDRWGRLSPGWSYEDVLPFFERSVTYSGDKSYLGGGGPWRIERSKGIASVDDRFIQAGTRLGYSLIDINSQSGPGLYYADTNQDGGWRHPQSEAFLQHRPNLHIVTNALVDKVEMERRPLRAVGVTFSKFGERLTVRAAREVVLAAGAINSPAVLMRSGVGPAQHLSEMGIPVLADLPVGRSLNSHFGAPLMFAASEPVSLLPGTLPSAIREYAANRTGPITSNLCTSGLFLASSESESPDWPDLQMMMCTGHLWVQGEGGEVVANLERQLYEEMLLEANDTTHGLMLFPYLLRPRSRGWVRLSSADPTSPPLIQPNALHERQDVSRLIEGLRTAAKLADTPPLKDIITREIVIKPCRNLTGDLRLECTVRQLTLTIYHPTSTCRMSPRDQGGVVDHQLRVHGVAGLRVMDASVMPFITSGNTNAPVTMIAEKGADMILSGL